MKSRNILVIGISLLFVSFMWNNSFSRADNGLRTVTSYEIEGNITLDGVIDDEWSAAISKNFTFNYRSGLSNFELDNTIEAEIMSVYNDTSLFMAFSVNKTDFNLAVGFRVNTEEPFYIWEEDDSLFFSDENDGKVLFAIDTPYYDANETGDYVTVYGSLVEDVQNNGINDVKGKCWTHSNSMNFEIMFPLDSGDSRGADVALKPGRSIDFFTWFFNSTSEFTPHSDIGQIIFYTLDLEGFYIPSYSVVVLLISILGVSTFLIVKQRKRRKN